MENIALPTHVTINELAENRAQLVLEPCYPGYGNTLGNSLRRVLLSSVPGAAIISVKIEGADHEFSTLPGVAEDVVEIILNLKGVRVKSHSNEEVKIKLSASGEKKVTAKDIVATSDVEIANPDHYIAKLTDPKAKLNMELTIGKGFGYVPVEQRDKVAPEIGVMMIDAIYTPVRTCSFNIENVRVGQMTNYDKLTVEVETDGTISPKEALVYAGSVLTDHYALVKNLA